jgi:hypothetical protein
VVNEENSEGKFDSKEKINEERIRRRKKNKKIIFIICLF